MHKLIEAPAKTFWEDTQEFPVKFAWVKKKDEDYVQQHYWVKCRDFLGDCFIFDISELKNIYKFSVKDFEDSGLLAVKYPHKKYAQHFRENLKYLNVLEKTKTKILNTEKETEIILQVPKFWRTSNVLLSLYTFLIKVYSKETWEDQEGCEAQYILATSHCFDKLLKNLHKLKFPTFKQQYEEKNSLEYYHNFTGFVSTFKKTSQHPLAKELNAL